MAAVVSLGWQCSTTIHYHSVPGNLLTFEQSGLTREMSLQLFIVGLLGVLIGAILTARYGC